MKHIAILSVLAVAASASVSAGFRLDSVDVLIVDAGRIASGTVGAARNSTDNMQFIYCYSTGAATGGCMARDATGLTRACTTTSAAQIAVIRSLRNDSYISFSWESTGGACTRIDTSISSRYSPKQP